MHFAFLSAVRNNPPLLYSLTCEILLAFSHKTFFNNLFND